MEIIENTKIALPSPHVYIGIHFLETRQTELQMHGGSQHFLPVFKTLRRGDLCLITAVWIMLWRHKK